MIDKFQSAVLVKQNQDLKILNIIENQKKGGLCFVGSQRHTVANSHYLENHDPTIPADYILCSRCYL
jgi:hypothetical protein